MKGTPIVVDEFKKKYTVSFQDRNNKNVKHLIIKNY
jgi:DNA adenine methylase